MVKHTLFCVALLIAAGTVALLGSPTNAEELTPVALTNAIQDKISGSQWEGDWDNTEYATGGNAGLYLIIGYGHADARISIQGSSDGDYTFRARGTVQENAMYLKSAGGRSEIWLSLYKKEGKFVLKGEWDAMSGNYVGQSGSYYFEKK